MSEDQPDNSTATNIDRLRKHLDLGTLAANLIDAYQISKAEDRATALKDIAEVRLAEIRAELAAENSPNGPD